MPARSVRIGRSATLLLIGLVAISGCRTLGPGDELAPVFFPLPPATPRVQFLTAINWARDVVPERAGFSRLVFGARPDLERAELIKRPHGIAVWQSRIYLVDAGAKQVKVFNLLDGTFSILGGNLGRMVAPTSIAVGSDGYKFVAEPMHRRIHVFGPEDAYLGSYELEEGRPADLVVIGTELFVADLTGNRIVVLDRLTGEILRSFGKLGGEPGELRGPNAIASDSEGNLYVCDQFNSRFQKLDRSGTPLLWKGEIGDAYGTFGRPRGIAVGPDGIIYVGDATYHHVQMFNQDGQVLMRFGSSHPAGGMYSPGAIAVDRSSLPYFSRYIDPRFEAHYLIFVTSLLGDQRIGVYAFGELKPGIPVPGLFIPSESR